MTDDPETVGVLVGVLLVLIVVGAIYMLPTIIAFQRGHHYRWIITALNVVLGATAIGYLVALVWAIWPSETALLDPFHGDPISPRGDTSQRIYERRGEQKQALETGEQWYYAIARHVQGPVARRELVGLLVRGNLKRTDLVWREGMQGWAQAGDVIPLPL